MYKRTLLALKTQRTAIVLVIDGLQEDLLQAPLTRIELITAEIERKQKQLSVIKCDISCLSPQVDRLKKEWAKSNVADVPITVVTFN
jgi:hypothetical protein